MADSICSVPGCDRPRKTRGWCNTHYERWRLGRDVNDPSDLRRSKYEHCTIDGCTDTVKGRGWCARHYQRWRQHGDPHKLERPTYGTKRRINFQGYVMVFAPDHPLAYGYGYVFEHRMVLHDAGIDVTDKNVHHKDGDKTNNVLSNLAVMSASDHTAEHHPVGSLVRNQYGVWPVRHQRPMRKITRSCHGCDGLIPATARRDAVYCSTNCRIAAWKRRTRSAQPELC